MNLLQVLVHGAGLRLENVLMRWAQLQLQQVPVVSDWGCGVAMSSGCIRLHCSTWGYEAGAADMGCLLLPLCRGPCNCKVMYRLNSIQY